MWPHLDCSVLSFSSLFYFYFFHLASLFRGFYFFKGGGLPLPSSLASIFFFFCFSFSFCQTIPQRFFFTP